MSSDVLYKTNRPGPSLLALSKVTGINLFGESGVDYRAMLETQALVLGLPFQIQVNNCQTAADFSSSAAGTFDVAVDASGRVGTNAIKMTSTGALNGTQYLETSLIDETKLPMAGPGSKGVNQTDWRDTRYLGFWVTNTSAGDFSTAGEMKVAIVNNGVESSQVNIQAIVNDVHQWFQIDMDGEGWTRDRVEKLRFYGNVGASEDLFVCDIVRYQYAFDRGPLYGCAFPIKSGTTLTQGELVRWTIEGLITSSTAQVADIGTCVLYADGVQVAPGGTLVGNAARSNWAIIPGTYMYIHRVSATTINGEGLIWSAARTSIGVTTTVDEFAVAKGLEAGGAANDDIFVLKRMNADYISA